MSRIGDLLFRLLADDSGFEADVVKKADKAGAAGEKTLGQRLGGALKSEGVKIFAGAASAAFALATKGALELENATARFRAETGASADEAERVGKVINKVAGDERMSLESVTDIAIRVKRDLGAVGDQADDLTARFARYARVTRQEAGGAVTDFDDILDAWNLTADKSGGIMDKLLASQQKWGGDLVSRQKNLAELAPQLSALNATVDDGIALQNLFAASGLDAGKAMFALNTAVQKVKPGQTFDDLIKQISSIEDPTERAQKAIEIFGARGGVALANVLRPGITSLDDFAVKADDAAGAVDKAADVLDTTFSGRIQKFFSQAGAAIRGFGADFGAATTAIASVGSLVAAAGGGKLIKALGKPLLVGARSLASKVIFEIGARFATSESIGALAGGIGGAIGKIPGAAAVKAGVGKLGSFMGSAIGKATAIGFGLVIIDLLLKELDRVTEANKQQLHDIGANVANEIASGTTASLEQSRGALQDAIKKLTPSAGAMAHGIDPYKAEREALQHQLDLVQAEIDARTKIAAGLAEANMRAAEPGARSAAEAMADVLPSALEKGQAAVANAAELWASKSIGEKLIALGHEARLRGAQSALALAGGLRDGRGAVTSAMAQLREDLKNAISPKKLAAKDIGLLFGKDITKGLKSSDPVVRAQAKATRALLEDELIETVKAGGKAGQDILDELNRKMKSKDPAVRDQAKRTKSVIDAALAADTGPKTPGEQIGNDLAADLKNKGPIVGKPAYNLGVEIAKQVRAGVKGTGYVAPSSSTGVTGTTYKQVPEYASGTWSVPGDQLALIHNREMVVPEASADAIRSGAAVLGATGVSGTSGPLIGELNVDARGATDPLATGDAVRRAVGDAVAGMFRDQSLRGPLGLNP